jgi:hypothetical protein
MGHMKPHHQILTHVLTAIIRNFHISDIRAHINGDAELAVDRTSNNTSAYSYHALAYYHVDSSQSRMYLSIVRNIPIVEFRNVGAQP